MAVGVASLASPDAGAAEPIRTAYLTPGTETLRESDIPPALSAADAQRYRAIFAYQERGEWSAADAEIQRLDSKLLLGHVLAQRYLDKRYRRVAYAELREWLAQYADLPDAAAIHAVALKRRPAHTKAPATPVGAPVPYRGVARAAVELRPSGKPEPLTLAGDEAARAAQLRAELRQAIKENRHAAEQSLRAAIATGLLSPGEIDDARADLVEAYFFNGEDQDALIQAAMVKTDAYKPYAHWLGGLAAWRLGRLGDARSHFEALAKTDGISPWNMAAASYWASRVHLRARRPQLVNYWLAKAAQQPRTLYGLLARRGLGYDTWFNFEADGFTEGDADTLAANPRGRRVLALLQAGQNARAEVELRMLASEASPRLLPALVAVADRGNMPAVSLQLAAMLSQRDGRRHDHALYPMPRWKPQGGFTVDRALLFAVMRQESEFLADAESPKGALGLMQMMPETARPIAEKAGIKLREGGRHARDLLLDKLREPETNLRLAQDYIQDLLSSDAIQGNLILFAAAYNWGPGAVARWKSRPEYKDDPLLFLESIPSRETRAFAAHVITSYWVYRLRFGQPTRDLDALASGRWPVYAAHDPASPQVVQNAAAR
jgi:soluble lytic murein transglycosylase-like protein